MPNFVMLMTADAQARVADRTPVLRGTFYCPSGQQRELLLWQKPGEPDVLQQIQYTFYQSSSDTHYVFACLSEAGQFTHQWVREPQAAGGSWYSTASGSFWDLYDPSLSPSSNPPVSEIAVEQDVVFLHTTTAFDDYVGALGPVIELHVNPVYLGNAPAAYMTRYEVETMDFDYLQQEVEGVYYKVVDGHKEWHVFLRARGVKTSAPAAPDRLLFGWSVFLAPGTFYSSSGLIRSHQNQEYVLATNP